MFLKIFLLLAHSHIVAPSLSIARLDTKTETLTCNKNMNCSKFSSLQSNSITCGCEGGTFYFLNNQMKCWKGTGLFARCSFYFHNFETSIQTINVMDYKSGGEFYSAEEFLYPIETAITCATITISKVEVLDGEMKWKEVNNEFKIVFAPSVGFYYYLRWVNPMNVNTVEYAGNIAKFTLKCVSKDGVPVSNCLLGKFEGVKIFDGDVINSVVCGDKKVVTTSQVPTTTSTIGSTIKTTVTPTSNNTKTDSQSQEGSAIIPIVIGIVAVILVIVFIVIVLCLWRKRKQSRSADETKRMRDVQDEHESIYAAPSGPKDVDNPSYLMGLKQNNTDANDNTDAQYTSPYANTDTQNSLKENNKNIYNNITPFTKNYYETPDQRSSLLKDSHSLIPPEYSTIDTDGAYVKMDEKNHDATLNQKGVYVSVDSI